MDHSTADESDVAVVDLPSTSGAHWANRDRDVLQRRTAGREAPFRRPPAVNSFQGDAPAETPGDADTSDSWDAFVPSKPDTSRASGASDAAWEPFAAGAAARRATPADPGTTTGSGRASFGVTDGPISGARPEPVSPAGPRSASTAPPAPATGDTGFADPRADSGAGFPDLRADSGASFPDLRADSGAGFPDLRADSAGGFPDLRADGAVRRGGGDRWFGDLVGGDDRHNGAGDDHPSSLAAGGGRASGAFAADPAPTAFPAFDDPAPAPAAGDAPAGIGEFMNGPGRDIRPHRVGDSPAPPVEHRRSRLMTAATILLSAVVLLGGAVAGVAFFAGDDESLTSVLRLGSGNADGKVATAPLDGRATASFELIAATTKVTLRTQDLGDRLFRITSAGDSGTAPSPVLSGDRVQLLLSPDGDGASGNVEVLLSAKVTWGLRFVGGTDEQVVDVTGGKVSSIDVAGGSRRVDLRLSQPTGTVPVRVTGAVDELSVQSPTGSPVRVKVDSGAKTVAAGDKTLRDVEPGSTLTPKDWKAPNRYDVDAASRVTLLTVRNTP